MVCDKEQLTVRKASIVFRQQEIIDLGPSVTPAGCWWEVRWKLKFSIIHPNKTVWNKPVNQLHSESACWVTTDIRVPRSGLCDTCCDSPLRSHMTTLLRWCHWCYYTRRINLKHPVLWYKYSVTFNLVSPIGKGLTGPRESHVLVSPGHQALGIDHPAVPASAGWSLV